MLHLEIREGQSVFLRSLLQVEPSASATAEEEKSTDAERGLLTNLTDTSSPESVSVTSNSIPSTESDSEGSSSVVPPPEPSQTTPEVEAVTTSEPEEEEICTEPGQYRTACIYES